MGALVEWLRGVGWGEIANLGGLLAALVGISLTGIQLLLLRRQLKLDALIKITDSNREIVSLGLEHPTVWGALEGGAEAPGSELALAHQRYLQLWMNHIQIMWAAWRLGLISRGEWQSYRLDMKDCFRVASIRDHWAKVARFYPRDFRRLVAALSPPSDEVSS